MRRIDKISKIKEKVNFYLTKSASGVLGAVLFALPIFGTMLDRMLIGETADLLKTIKEEGNLLIQSSFFERKDDEALVKKTIEKIDVFLSLKISENSSDEEIDNFVTIAYDVMNRLSALPGLVDHNLNYFESFLDSVENVVGANKSNLNAKALLKTLDPSTISGYLSKIRVGGGVLQGLTMGLSGVLTGLTGGLAVPVVTGIVSAVTGIMSIAQDFKFSATEASNLLNKDLIIIQDKIKEVKSKPTVQKTNEPHDSLSDWADVDLTI